MRIGRIIASRKGQPAYRFGGAEEPMDQQYGSPREELTVLAVESKTRRITSGLIAGAKCSWGPGVLRECAAGSAWWERYLKPNLPRGAAAVPQLVW